MSGYPVGRLNMDAEVGTILGPDTAGELLVVSARDEAGVLVSYATVQDIEAARGHRLAYGPRSLVERGPL